MEDNKMNWKSFWAKVISAWAWPVVLLIIILCFKDIIHQKITQVSRVDSGFFAVDFFADTKAKLIYFSENGIESSEDLKELERLADKSRFVADYLATTEQTGPEFQLAEAAFAQSRKMLEDIKQLQNMQDAGFDTTRLAKIKEDMRVLEEHNIDPDIIREPDGIAKVTERAKTIRRPDDRLKALVEDRSNLARLKRDLDSLDRIKVDPKQIQLDKVKPEIIRDYKVDTARFEQYRRPNVKQLAPR